MTEIVRQESRELSVEEHEKRGEECKEIEGRIKDALRIGREAGWMLAQACYEFNEASGWSKLGYETKTAWLSDPAIDMAESTFHKIVARWREYVVNRKIELSTLRAVDPSKADIVLPAITSNKFKRNRVLEDATKLSARALREKYVRKAVPESTDPEPEPAEVEAEVVDGEVVEEEKPPRRVVPDPAPPSEPTPPKPKELPPAAEVTPLKSLTLPQARTISGNWVTYRAAHDAWSGMEDDGERGEEPDPPVTQRGFEAMLVLVRKGEYGLARAMWNAVDDLDHIYSQDFDLDAFVLGLIDAMERAKAGRR